MSAPREFPNASQAWKYLQKNTAAVKARELRQKMMDDIERIKSRKSKDVVIPVSQDLQEEWFAKLEGNGVWKQALENLENPSDITSAYYSCDVFQNHLEEKRMMMYLPHVFAVLRDRKYMYYFENLNGELNNEDQERNIGVLNQRTVSKAWKKAAEEQFLEPTAFSCPNWHLTRYGDEEGYERNICGPVSCLFRNVDNVDLAMNALPTGDLCSSLLRTIFVNDENSGNPVTFYEKIRQFLDIHGKSVWSFGFVQNEVRHSYQDFWICVSRMPNLKDVCLDCSHLDFPEDEEERLLRRYPFPILPALKRLSIAIANASRDKLLAAGIMQRNPWLQTVCLDLELEEPGGLLNDISPVLSNLNLECFALRVLNEMGTLEDVQPLRELQWRLKVLNLEIDSLTMMNASEVFEILNQFNDSLEEVSLDYMELKDDDKTVIVDFPNLKKIGQVSIAI